MITLTQKQAWFLITRPRSLALSVVPVLLGIVLASITAQINWGIALCTILFALCIQIATNLFNDALDFKKGVDAGERLGPPRMTQSGHLAVREVLFAGYALLAAALLFGIPLIDRGGWPLMLLLGISAVLAYAYTGGPIPLSYTGLAEIFVLPFFGLAATGVSYYLQTGSISAEALLAGTQIGLLATLPIPLNNLRDHKGDAAGNKRTLVVRFGIPFGRGEVAFLALLPFALSFLWLSYSFTWAAILPWIALPLAIVIIRKTWNVKSDREYNPIFFKSLLLHLSFGVLLGIGVWLS